MTEADLAADAFLKRRLGEAFPEAGWLSEETADDAARLDRRALIVVDPIDGTRAFVAGDPRWTVSAALIVDGRPIAGVVHAPALEQTYAAARGAGARLNGKPIATAAPSDGPGYTVAGPKPLLGAMARATRRDPGHPAFRAVARLPHVHGGERSARFRRRRARTRTIGTSPPPISCSRRRAAGSSSRRESGCDTIEPRIRRGALLGAPDALAPQLLEAFRAAAGA